MPKDYVEIEYACAKRPVTTYPHRLAQHIANVVNMKPGQSLVEVGSGRAEVARGFASLGLEVTCIDEAPSAAQYAADAGAAFVSARIDEGISLPLQPQSQDYAFTKSFLEHLPHPIPFLESCLAVLRPGGAAVMLTPDWEANFKIFFDDVTHVTPFTRETMRQALELAGFSDIETFRFRQLPATWTNPFVAAVSAGVAPFVPVRTKSKFLRWSRELMLCGIARKPNDSGV